MATRKNQNNPEPEATEPEAIETETETETEAESSAPSLFGFLYNPDVEVTVTSRMVEVKEEHKHAAAGAIALYKKDSSAWLKLGPIPVGPITLPDGSVKSLDNKELADFFDDFLTPVKVAGNQMGYVIRKGTSQNPRVLRYHVTGPVKASGNAVGSTPDETEASGTETGEASA